MVGHTPLLLAILDGWGERDEAKWNAIRSAPARNFEQLRNQYPATLVAAAGQQVGLPKGLMGNSEVGHLNIGAGRIVWQDIERINRSIEDRTFFANAALVNAMQKARQANAAVHLMGLLSDGGVHSSQRHYLALLKLCKEQGFPGDRVFFHALLDGRDTPPRSAKKYIRELEQTCVQLEVGRIATIIGRYYAMDRDQRWERVQRAYDALVKGIGAQSASAVDALENSYSANISDEFVLPTVIGNSAKGRIQTNDSVLLFNFRADRMRQMAAALTGKEFTAFARGPLIHVQVVTMTEYQKDLPVQIAYPPQYIKQTFGELIAKAGLKQLRIAETEKYAHVTYFFNGGNEQAFANEQRILIPSPKVATYDLQPEMSAPEVTSTLMQNIEQDAFDVYILNYANPDMLGHTGVWEATLSAVRLIDQCLGELAKLIQRKKGMMAITADHGNCELMYDETNNMPHTAHTTNPVPLVLVADEYRKQGLRAGGKLGDLAPTLLHALGMEIPKIIAGNNLLI